MKIGAWSREEVRCVLCEVQVKPLCGLPRRWDLSRRRMENRSFQWREHGERQHRVGKHRARSRTSELSILGKPQSV